MSTKDDMHIDELLERIEQLQKDKAELVHALEDMDILLDIDDYLWKEEDEVLRQKSKAIADKHNSNGADNE